MDEATKYFISGKEKFKKEEFDASIEDLKHAVEKGAPKGESAFIIAESYRQSNRIDEAEKFYRIAIEEDYVDDHADFYYAYALKANQKYSAAKKVFKRYIKIGSNFEYINQAKKELKNLEALEEIIKKKPLYQIENCTEINSEGLDYRPVIIKDEFYYTSSRGEGPVYTGNGERFSDIYRYTFDGATKYSGQPRPLNNVINQEKTHEADATFSPDGRTMIFSRNSNGKKNDVTQEVDLFESKFINGEWAEPKRLDFSETFSWDSNPWLSPTGDTLYFSSNREGGLGGDDIWFVTKDINEEWGSPVNMGATVNTAGDEQFPYTDKNGHFYFSSDGHPGLGGLDLFALKNNQVENLGRPLNSSADDFAIFFKDDENGYFSSNREGGVGSDDIYAFKNDCDRKYILQVYVNHQIQDTNNEPSDSVEPIPGATVFIEKVPGQYVATLSTDENGLASFEELESETAYIIHAKDPNHIKQDVSFQSKDLTVDQNEIKDCEPIVTSITINMRRIKDSLVLEFPPILYAYNKSDILPESEAILRDMAQTLKDNPSILVELGSHTDARGTVRYNDILSQKRAEAAVKWIIEKGGVDPKRIAAKGYGERVPRKLNADTAVFKKGTLLTEKLINQYEKTNKEMFELGHQMNRRTEFKVVGIIEQPVDPSHIKVIDNGAEEENPERDKLDNEDEIIKRNFGVDKDYEVDKEEGEYEEGTNKVKIIKEEEILEEK